MYDKLSKSEKKKIDVEYRRTAKGIKLCPVLDRLIIEGIACLLFAIGITIGIIYFEFSKWYFIVVGLLVVSGIVFLIVQHNIRKKEYNKFISSKKKRK